MGQGYSLTTLSAGSAGIDVPELADLSYEKSLGDARFMKSIRARHREGLVVVKVVMKPYATMKFEKYVRQIMRSTRPFLEDIEKRWLAFQLLNAVKDCHSQNLFHGDIKSENVLVTSWNWLFLSDFSASYKPSHLPEDNPADFSFFFDISGKRTCYLAPERFLAPGESVDGRSGITWAMDIFSVGCVIAELFLETPMFNLSQLFNYRQGKFDPVKAHLDRIEDRDVRDLVVHMIQLEPEARYSADEYLNFWRQKAFPEYFYSFLHQYMHLITDPSSGRAAILSEDSNFGESDDRISRLYYDFDKISYFLGYEQNGDKDPAVEAVEPSRSILPLHLNLPYRRSTAHAKRFRLPAHDGTLLFLNIITSSLRSTARATPRLQACELLLAFSEYLSDEVKLDRVLPFVMSLIDDQSETVKVTAMRTLTQLVAMVSSTSPVNAYIFPEYIIPKLSDVFPPGRRSKPTNLFRIAYAQCMAPLAETASRFLDSIHALKVDGSLPSADPLVDNNVVVHAYQDMYDIARADLIRFFETQTKTLLTDSDTDVRRTFLGSVASLCIFFGSAKANDVILSHLNTYLNDRDWKLKCAFFDTIVGVATYVGGNNLEEFILPLMIQALSDPEEFVLERVLRSLSVMAQLGLFQRTTTWELIDLVARFAMHPNVWIREAATDFISNSTKYISTADCHCIVRPRLGPYLKIAPKDYSEVSLLDALKRPLDRATFEQAAAWAVRSDKSSFWKPIQQRKNHSTSRNDSIGISSRDLDSNLFSKLTKSEDDAQWVKRLRDAGMSSEDEMKLLSLGDHIWRMAQRRSGEDQDPQVQRMSRLQQLAELQIPLNNITFENQRELVSATNNQDIHQPEAERTPQTITDALLDASTTIQDTGNRRPSPQAPARANNAVLDAQARGATDERPSPRVSSPLSAPPLALDMDPETPTGARKDHQEASAQDPRKPRGAERGSETRESSMQHRESAMNLMDRRDATGKATAETGTSATNAVGKIDGLQNGDRSQGLALTLAHQAKQSQSGISYKGEGGYNYEGRDPNVIRLLDSLYLENYPIDVVDFGPFVVPMDQRPWNERKTATSDGAWRPEGSMVAMLAEHMAAVNRVIVSPDHQFFITGSDDSTVKIWDTGRLERNLAHRSRQTHKHANGVRVTSLCFVENTHCFVSAGSDGSIHVVKVDCSEGSQGAAKYGKIKVLRQWQLPDAPKSHAVWIEHYRSESHSLLLIATSNSLVLGVDLRNMEVMFTLNNPIHYGTPTCFCLGADRHNKHHWLLLGTSHGILSLWDLRFRVRLRTFAFSGGSPIHRICLHPDRTSRKVRVCIAGGTGAADLTVWDLEKFVCREVYRTDSAGAAHYAAAGHGSGKQYAANTATTVPSTKPYTPWYPDNSPRSSLLARFGPKSSLETGASDGSQPSPSVSVDPNKGFRALCVGGRHRSSSSNANASGKAVPNETEKQILSRNGYLITAGGAGSKDSNKVRFWDMDRIEHSIVVSGLEGSDGGNGRKRSGVEATQPEYGVVGPAGKAAECVIFEEHMAIEKLSTQEGRDGASKKTSSTSGTKGGRGHLLLQNHLDTVLDVAVIEQPYHMVISVDRSGIIFAFA
ncbi:MAG: Serine/threonine-protein kinase [Alyxoria varia]|nr:MAG: Serine/threonine-protein kinase [Alyxoria varia]